MRLKISCKINEKNIQKQSPRGFLTKWQYGILQTCSKFDIQIYENCTYASIFSCKFAACLQNTSGGLLLNIEKYPRTLEI